LGQADQLSVAAASIINRKRQFKAPNTADAITMRYCLLDFCLSSKVDMTPTAISGVGDSGII